ncbi:DivIVA domain-containing protein [Thermodesulfitimonas sp.]
MTPYDVYKKEFRRVFCGYDEQEVDEFLDQVAAVLKELYREVEELRAQTQHGNTGYPATASDIRLKEVSAVPDVQRAQRELEAKVQALRQQVAEVIDMASLQAAQRAEDVMLQAEARLGELVAKVEEETERRLHEAEQRMEAMLAEAAQKLRFLFSREMSKDESTRRRKTTLVAQAKTRKMWDGGAE